MKKTKILNIYLLLGKYEFNSKNAYALAKIGVFYAKKMGLNVAMLKNHKFSVANMEQDVNWYAGKSLYNDGVVGGVDDIMNCDDINMKITFSLKDGFVSELLNDIDNMKSTLYHEFDHLNYKDNNGTEHLYVYYNQMKHSLFKNTTSDFKENAYKNVKDLINQMSNYSNDNWTKAQQKEFKKQTAIWKQKFINLGVKF